MQKLLTDWAVCWVFVWRIPPLISYWCRARLGIRVRHQILCDRETEIRISREMNVSLNDIALKSERDERDGHDQFFARGSATRTRQHRPDLELNGLNRSKPHGLDIKPIWVRWQLHESRAEQRVITVNAMIPQNSIPPSRVRPPNSVLRRYIEVNRSLVRARAGHA